MTAAFANQFAAYTIIRNGQKGDLAEYGDRELKQHATAADVWADMVATVKRAGRSNPAPPAPAKSPLSIKLEPGKCTYLIKLDAGTRAAFGPDPVMILPREISTGLLSEVGVLSFDPDADAVTFNPADTSWPGGTFDPQATALTFTCDRGAMEAMWDAAVVSHGHTLAMNIPFFLNLYDTVTKLPVWSFGGHHLIGHNPGVMTHGGIHPSGSQALY